MMPSWVALVSIVILGAFALFLALIDVAFDYVSKISLRTYREESWKTEFLTQSLEEPLNLLLPLRIGLQGAFVALTVLTTMLYLVSSTELPLLKAFGTMVVGFLVVREAIPMIIARKNPEKVLLALLPAFRIYASIVSPISRPLAFLVKAFSEVEVEQVTEEDVQAYIEAGEDEGILEGDEGRMVQSIVALGDKQVREVMTPRPEMIAVASDATMAELRSLFIEEKYSRVPVFEDNLDHILGLVYAIDLVAASDADPEGSFRELIREVRFVPETKRVSQLLRELQRSNQTLAIVVDEYGGTSGLVTVEDILEEIVGEIHDEFDEVANGIVKEREGVFLISGRADIDDVKEELRLEVNGSGFETVSGYVLDAIGRIPKAGEIIEHEGIQIEVVDADDQRIHMVRFRLPLEGSR